MLMSGECIKLEGYCTSGDGVEVFFLHFEAPIHSILRRFVMNIQIMGHLFFTLPLFFFFGSHLIVLYICLWTVFSIHQQIIEHVALYGCSVCTLICFCIYYVIVIKCIFIYTFISFITLFNFIFGLEHCTLFCVSFIRLACSFFCASFHSLRELTYIFLFIFNADTLPSQPNLCLVFCLLNYSEHLAHKYWLDWLPITKMWAIRLKRL